VRESLDVRLERLRSPETPLEVLEGYFSGGVKAPEAAAMIRALFENPVVTWEFFLRAAFFDPSVGLESPLVESRAWAKESVFTQWIASSPHLTSLAYATEVPELLEPYLWEEVSTAFPENDVIHFNWPRLRRSIFARTTMSPELRALWEGYLPQILEVEVLDDRANYLEIDLEKGVVRTGKTLERADWFLANRISFLTERNGQDVGDVLRGDQAQRELRRQYKTELGGFEVQRDAPAIDRIRKMIERLPRFEVSDSWVRERVDGKEILRAKAQGSAAIEALVVNTMKAAARERTTLSAGDLREIYKEFGRTGAR
jgi:hypothetical protein